MIDLKTLVGKRIQLIDMDGDTFIGQVCDYFFPDDNPPDFTEEAIAVHNPIKNSRISYANPVVFNASEIKKVEILNK